MPFGGRGRSRSPQQQSSRSSHIKNEGSRERSLTRSRDGSPPRSREQSPPRSCERQEGIQLHDKVGTRLYACLKQNCEQVFPNLKHAFGHMKYCKFPGELIKNKERSQNISKSLAKAENLDMRHKIGHRSREHFLPRSLERSPPRSHERTPSRSRERTPQRSHERSPHRSRERSLHRSHERSPHRSRECSPTRSRERSPHRSHVRSPPRSRKPSPHRSCERFPQRSRERSPHRSHERSPHRSCSRSPYRSRERSPHSSRERQKGKKQCYACLKQNCEEVFPNWENACQHMNKCEFPGKPYSNDFKQTRSNLMIFKKGNFLKISESLVKAENLDIRHKIDHRSAKLSKYDRSPQRAYSPRLMSEDQHISQSRSSKNESGEHFSRQFDGTDVSSSKGEPACSFTSEWNDSPKRRVELQTPERGHSSNLFTQRLGPPPRTMSPHNYTPEIRRSITEESSRYSPRRRESPQRIHPEMQLLAQGEMSPFHPGTPSQYSHGKIDHQDLQQSFFTPERRSSVHGKMSPIRHGIPPQHPQRMAEIPSQHSQSMAELPSQHSQRMAEIPSQHSQRMADSQPTIHPEHRDQDLRSSVHETMSDIHQDLPFSHGPGGLPSYYSPKRRETSPRMTPNHQDQDFPLYHGSGGPPSYYSPRGRESPPRMSPGHQDRDLLLDHGPIGPSRRRESPPRMTSGHQDQDLRRRESIPRMIPDHQDQDLPLHHGSVGPPSYYSPRRRESPQRMSPGHQDQDLRRQFPQRMPPHNQDYQHSLYSPDRRESPHRIHPDHEKLEQERIFQKAHRPSHDYRLETDRRDGLHRINPNMSRSPERPGRERLNESPLRNEFHGNEWQHRNSLERRLSPTRQISPSRGEHFQHVREGPRMWGQMSPDRGQPFQFVPERSRTSSDMRELPPRMDANCASVGRNAPIGQMNVDSRDRHDAYSNYLPERSEQRLISPHVEYPPEMREPLPSRMSPKSIESLPRRRSPFGQVLPYGDSNYFPPGQKSPQRKMSPKGNPNQNVQVLVKCQPSKKRSDNRSSERSPPTKKRSDRRSSERSSPTRKRHRSQDRRSPVSHEKSGPPKSKFRKSSKRGETFKYTPPRRSNSHSPSRSERSQSKKHSSKSVSGENRRSRTRSPRRTNSRQENKLSKGDVELIDLSDEEDHHSKKKYKRQEMRAVSPKLSGAPIFGLQVPDNENELFSTPPQKLVQSKHNTWNQQMDKMKMIYQPLPTSLGLESSKEVNHFDQRPSKPQFDKPTGLSLLENYRAKLSASNKPLSTADDMMLYWRLAGHNEQTIRALMDKKKPNSPKALRLCLLSVLHLVPAGNVPMSVVVSDLLDMTIEYFMPNQQKENMVGGLNRTNHPPTNLGRKESVGVGRVKEGPGGDIGEIERRIASLEPLQEFIAKNMRTIQNMFGYTENYITMVSKNIQKVLGQAGVELLNLKRDFRMNGEDYVGNRLRELLRNYQNEFPKGVDISTIVIHSINFLSEGRQGY